MYRSVESGQAGPKAMFDTDVHEGVRDGNGKFNWRFVFPNVPVPSRFPRLRLQVFDYNVFTSDSFLCESLLNLENIFKEAQQTQQTVARGKRFFKLSSPNFPGEPRGEIDIQILLLPMMQAAKSPVGSARDKPNESPFLPDPVRESKGFFDSGLFKFVRIAVILGVLIAIIAAIFVGSAPPEGGVVS